jgi:hypothetical protein
MNIMQINRKIFLDFDNTLAHSLYASDEPHADSLLYDYSEHFVGEKFQIRHDGWYVSFKRSWCDDLITFSKQLIGPDNVYILTTGTQEYIRWCNVHLQLGFDPNTHIFGREDIRNNIHPYKLFTDTYNVLVDNMDYRDHAMGVGKVTFLNKIPRTQYVKVSDFEVWSEPLGRNEEYFEKVTSDIIEAFNL